ncbi:2-dehydro-3-deoxygalactonokinase [Paraburkholderia sp. J12]|uniref:2-dehydro-3-deoxygalactonokinase n=1 Tax=Paraburkholderia sp. J12 TaxID=2805432 RepID=UPI002ABE2453|nr:2-dehydro-3-deoxygalactonokinase [Paraburkholderia sp. J12]
MKPSFISLDWGTSSLRAVLVSEEGAIIEARSAAGGVMSVKDRQFPASLNAICSDWIETFGCPIVASGMIGSRQGWREAPYLDCPATPATAARALTTLQISDRVDMHIIPGLRCGSKTTMYDVMRGEETQIWGADVEPDSVCVLPGTHSKWAFVDEQSRITRFATYMTGELYGLLTKHGILGRLMEFGVGDKGAFARGATLGLNNPAQATHAIFAARTAGLMGEVPATGLPDYLSGILIGVEVASALAAEKLSTERPLYVIGDDDLCCRYEAVLEMASLRSVRAPDGATIQGHVCVAREAGILVSESA